MLTGMVAFICLFGMAAASENVAMVLEVKGAVTVESGQGPARPVKIMALLGAGDRLALPEKGEATLLIFGDKHRERLGGGHRVTLTADGCTPATGVERKEAVNPGSAVRYQDVHRLSGGGKVSGVTFRDPALPKSPPTVTPMFGATVLVDRPTLSWKAVPGATQYLVRLRTGRIDTTAGSGTLLWTATTKEPNLSYPVKEKPLRFGRIYTWHVVATTDQKTADACESQFSVTTQAESEELDKFMSLAKGKDQADLLLAALTYQEHGAYDEALDLFERLARLRPEEAQFQAALADYYGRAGRPKEAEAAFERAKELGFAAE